MRLYHMFSWGAGIVTSVILLATNQFGKNASRREKLELVDCIELLLFRHLDSSCVLGQNHSRIHFRWSLVALVFVDVGVLFYCAGYLLLCEITIERWYLKHLPHSKKSADRYIWSFGDVHVVLGGRIGDLLVFYHFQRESSMLC